MYNYLILILLNSMNKTFTSASKVDDSPHIHLQNMKDELFMMKYGYWVKTSDTLEELDKKFELKKWRQFQNHIEFKYESKSKYPDIVLQKKDNPPHFNFDNIEHSHNVHRSSIFDKNDNNCITYAHISYVIDSRPYVGSSNLNKIIIDNKLIDKQLESRIRTLESMIYLFETCFL